MGLYISRLAVGKCSSSGVNTLTPSPQANCLGTSPTPQLLQLKNLREVVCVGRTKTTHNPELQYSFSIPCEKTSTGDSKHNSRGPSSGSVCLRQGCRVPFEILLFELILVHPPQRKPLRTQEPWREPGLESTRM